MQRRLHGQEKEGKPMNVNMVLRAGVVGAHVKLTILAIANGDVMFRVNDYAASNTLAMQDFIKTWRPVGVEVEES